MRRIAVLAGVLGVACIALLVTCVNGADTEEQVTDLQEITIQVGPTKYSYVGSGGLKIWVPEFPDSLDREDRDEFSVTVEWEDRESIERKFEEWGVEAGEDRKLKLTLSEFELVARNPRSESEDGGEAWEKDERYDLLVEDTTNDQGIMPGERASLVFVYDLDAPTERTSKTVKIDRVMKEDWKVREGEEPRRDQLVFFKLTLSRGDDDDVLFEVDPPWVPKPPTG